MIERLENFFFRPIRFRGLYLMRMLLGGAIFLYYARLLPHVQAIFGPGGVGGFDARQRWPAFPFPAPDALARPRLLALTDDPVFVWALYASLLLCSACFSLGLRPRITGIASVVLHLIFASHQPYLVSGWAAMLPAFTLYVSLAPSGGAWSLDSLLKGNGFRPATTPEFTPWSLRLLQVHVFAMYTTVGWPRLIQPGWLKGEQVLHAVLDTRFSRWDVDWLAIMPLLVLGSYFAMLVEPLATLLLPFRATRRWCALGLLALHCGLELVADIGLWQFTMAAGVLAFLPDPWFKKIPGFASE